MNPTFSTGPDEWISGATGIACADKPAPVAANAAEKSIAMGLIMGELLEEVARRQQTIAA